MGILAIVHGDLTLYWILKLSWIGILFLFGWWYQKNYRNIPSSRFWVTASIIILCYALFEGLRWERGVDYHNYMLEFSGIITRDDREPLYMMLVWFIQTLNLPFFIPFILMSGLFWFSVVDLSKKFPLFFCWLLLIMYNITDYPQENLVRQFLGMSFFLLAFSQYFKGNIKLSLILLICAPLCHSSGWLGVAAFLLLFLVRNKNSILKNPWPLVAVYTLFYFLWDVSMVNQYIGFIDKLNVSEDTQFSGYLQDGQQFFGSESSLNSRNSVYGEKSVVSILGNYLFDCIVIYFGFFCSKMDKRLFIPYWFAVASIFFGVIGGDLELWMRLGWWFKIVSPIAIASVLALSPVSRTVKLCIIGVYLLHFAYPFLRSLWKMPYSGCAFIWDI